MPADDVLDLVEQACAADLSAKALRERVAALVGRVVGFDAYNFPLTDPATLIGTSPLADVPMLPWPRLPELIRWRYQSPAQRWDRLVGGRAATSLLTAGRPEDSPLWLHVQRELGVRDTATTVFADRFGCWAILDLWRTTGSFSTDELAFLDSLAPLVALGLRRALARTFDSPGDDSVQLGPAILVLNPDLQVQAQTVGAAATLLQLNPPDEPMAPIPAAAYNIGAALLAQEAGMPIGPEVSSRVNLSGNRWVSLRADRLGTDIAVSIEPATAAARLDLVARSFALSVRETEVLGLIGNGLDSREIAEALTVSLHTANDHVKAVLAKTGWRTRQVLLARALG